MVVIDYSDEELEKILHEKFTNPFRKGYINVKGVTMPERFKDLQEDIANWEINNEDIWLCSYPKTGTTWTQEMIWMIANNLDFEGAKEILGLRSPFLEYSVLFDYRDLMENNKNFKPPLFLEDSLTFAKNIRSPYMKTHLPWKLIPNEIQNGKKKPKIIYVARNPKDTCLSYYHHCQLLEAYAGEFDEFCTLFLAGKIAYGSFWDHVLPFWNMRHQSNVLFLKYEDMKKDLPKIIRQVTEFIGCSLTNEQVQILADHLSFENMKKNRAVNYSTLVEFNKENNLVDNGGSFMRSGTIGSHKTIMSPEMIEKFDKWTEDNIAGTDYVV